MLAADLILLGLSGLVLGSFLGALTYRLPKGLGFVKGRSFCDKCRESLPWYDNIPVLSYLLLAGRSRCCHKKISPRYPLIELASFLGSIGIYLVSQNIFYVLVFFLCLAIFVIDFENKIIPDELVFFGLVVAVVFFLATSSTALFLNLLAGFLAALFLLGIHLITRGRGMGLGDVKFALFGGTALGLKLAVIWLFLAFLTGGALGVILILLGKARLKSRVAFGPFLVFALVLSFLWGEKIFSLLL